MATGENRWVVDIEERVESINKCREEELWKKPSIYIVPAFARELKPKAFTPHLASFGPYHHHEDGSTSVEEHKHRAVAHLVKRSGKPLDDFIRAIGGVVQQLQDSYEYLDEKWKDRDQFVKLMIVDGCFMLEVLRLDSIKDDYASNDPFFSDHGKLHLMPYVRRDMLMIENQIPLQVLKMLVEVEGHQPILVLVLDDNGINKLVLKFVAGKEDATLRNGLGLHALDLFHQSLLQGELPRYPPLPQRKLNLTTIPSAVELHEAGVRFKLSKTTSLRGIEFGRDGILHLPLLLVDDATECTFLNLVAFEHRHISAGNEVTSFLSFMDEIIDSAKDVALLHHRGIIQNSLGSDKAVAELFNCLSKDTTIDPYNNLGKVREAVNVFCQKRLNKWMASLRHTYFTNPWSSLSLAGALLVIALTIGQTVYTILGYYHDSSSGPSAPPPPPHY